MAPSDVRRQTKTVFVLRENLKEREEPLWFWMMTPIGPCTTADPAERQQFETRGEALACPCWQHSLTFWEIEEVPVDVTDEEKGPTSETNQRG